MKGGMAVFNQAFGGKCAFRKYQSGGWLFGVIKMFWIGWLRGAAFHWGWLVLFVRALAHYDAAPHELVLVRSLVDTAGVMVCYICTSQA